MLEVEDLAVSYGGIQAVTEASLAARSGEITCIIGRNGAGKSSLVNALAGQVKSTGRVTLDGVDVSGMPAWKRARVGLSLVPEDRRIFASLSVRENLTLASPKAGSAQSAALENVLQIFPEIQNFLSRPGNQISGGQQQMVAIGRGLMRAPKLLILDEPSLGLAPIVVSQVFAAIKEIASSGQGVLLIEQNARAALDISTRGYAMSLGRLKPIGDETRNLDAEKLAEIYL